MQSTPRKPLEAYYEDWILKALCHRWRCARGHRHTLIRGTTAQAQTKKPDSVKTAAGSAIKTRTASCNCGQLRVTCKGPDPERRSMCHCYVCQKQTGSAFSINARFPKEQVTIEGNSTAWKFPIDQASHRRRATETANPDRASGVADLEWPASARGTS